MDWTRPIDAYCERLDPGFWAEPVNALTNAAFVLVALLLWRRLGPPVWWPLSPGHWLCAALAAIGLGSFLFHTHATAWAGLADVAPILAFILLYLYRAHRDFWGQGRGVALVFVALFVPFALGLGAGFAWLGLPGGAAGYAPVVVLIAAHGVALRRRAPATARGLALGAGLLAASLTFRSLDGPLCAVWPLGTHFMWHLLNAGMLGWMIELWRRHRARAAPPALADSPPGG